MPDSHPAQTLLENLFWPVERDSHMTRIFISAGFICHILVALAACAPTSEPEPEPASELVFDQASEEEAIRKSYEQIYAAANNHDAKAYMALYTDNYESWDGSIKGRAAWEEYLSEFWTHNEDRQYEIVEDIGIIFVKPDVALYKCRGRTIGVVDENGSQLPPMNRLWANIFVKVNGQWLIEADFSQSIDE
jgi:ketosteroid isomerase-like protein